MKQKALLGLLFCFCLFVFSPAAVAAPAPEDLVLSMTKFMNSLPQFYVSGTANYDKVFQDNNKIMYSFDFDYYVKRPSDFQLNFAGDLQNKQILFNGNRLAIYDEEKAAYAVIDAPPTIDAALDKAADDYGLSMSILDVARSDFASNLLKDVVKSVYVGRSSVGEIPCHSVAFAKEDRNIQLWIEAGERPFLRKVAITFKKNPAMPIWIVEISDWNLAPVLPEGWSTFVVKPGMRKIEFRKPADKPVS